MITQPLFFWGLSGSGEPSPIKTKRIGDVLISLRRRKERLEPDELRQLWLKRHVETGRYRKGARLD